MKTTNYFTIDLGATSGRTILYTVSPDGSITEREVSRFSNIITHLHGHDYWNLWALYEEIIRALRQMSREGIALASIGIDTWGVDVVPFAADGTPLRNPICYRDAQTEGIPERIFAEMPQEEVYALTGIETMNFNTLFQLRAMHDNDNSAFRLADKWLFMPDALSALLTNEMVCERTIASTSMLLNPQTGDWEDTLLSLCGVRREQMPPLVEPGTMIGSLTPDVQQLTGLGAIPVVAVAGHDTASAVAAIPHDGRGALAFLSSGTWSLMGLESPQPIINARSARENITNEAGIAGTTTFLKNLCGMWLLESCRREWKEQGVALMGYNELAEAAFASTCNALIATDDARFSNPSSMLQEIAAATGLNNLSQGDYARIIYRSLTQRYKEVFALLQEFSSTPIEQLHIIGGGSQNDVLNQMIADALGITVIAGPSECTALGNLLMQMYATSEGKTSITTLRGIVAKHVSTRTFSPEK